MPTGPPSAAFTRAEYGANAECPTGYAPIFDLLLCESAALSWGMPWGGNGTTADYPRGCYALLARTVYFNDHETFMKYPEGHEEYPTLDRNRNELPKLSGEQKMNLNFLLNCRFGFRRIVRGGVLIPQDLPCPKPGHGNRSDLRMRKYYENAPNDGENAAVK